MTSRTVLAAGAGEVLGDEYLPCRAAEVFWGRLPCAADAPLLTVRSGASVTIDTLSHEGLLEDQGRDPRKFFGTHGVPPELILDEAVALASSGRPHDPVVDGPHVVTGPIAVAGAQPGDLLALTVLDTTRRVPYGVISNRHGRGALPGEMPLRSGTHSAFATVRADPDGSAFGVLPLAPGSDRTVSFPLAPFLGIMGVAVPGTERPHSVPPGVHGGNLDINLLTAGSTLYLPVQVPGALAYVGDPHYSQGDGEVALTAFEASLRVTLRLDLLTPGEVATRFGDLAGPVAETQDFLIPTGLDEDLDVAVRNCVRAALGLLQARYGMDRALALAYLSAATDFDISQVVDVVKGVHGRIRKADFTR
nr:acetamidase/formamidase family protein [Micromonospora sp. DSM 115978]